MDSVIQHGIKLSSIPGGILGILPKKYETSLKAAGVVAIAIFFSAPVRVVVAVGRMLWTSVGVAIGVGSGFGLAMHVYEQLQAMTKANEMEKAKPRTTSRNPFENIKPKGSMLKPSSSALEDASSYFALMALAGYPVEDKVLRGQVIKDDASFWDVKYRFTDVSIDHQKGPAVLSNDWPSLPPPITRELGRFVEHVMRDYVGGWYSRLDGGCVFMDEKEKRKMGILRDGQRRQLFPPSNGVQKISVENEEYTESIPGQETEHSRTKQTRKMVFSTVTHRNIPMLDQTYRVLSAAFGSLATRTEHVNVLSLGLLKWTQVLSHTFKVYRSLRRSTEDKNQTDNPSEIQVTREFLLTGKLHKAVTFGLDVPSLLFADAQGAECGTGTDQPPKDATQVLEERLFNTPILKECEVDYNRVVASRLVRALLPKADSSSQVVVALVVEIFACCVLQPLMNLWTPSFLNELIVNSMATKNAGDSPSSNGFEDETSLEVENITNETRVSREGAPTKSSKELFGNGKVMSSPPKESSVLNAEETLIGQQLFSPSNIEGDGLLVSNSTEYLPSETGDVDSVSFGYAENNIDKKSKVTISDVFLELCSAALLDLQQHVDSEQCHSAGLNKEDADFAYNHSSCQQAAVRLVMVLEAALLHGRCSHGKSKKEMGKGNAELEGYAPEESFSQHLMELTSDMEAFEKRSKSKSPEVTSLHLLYSGPDRKFTPDENEISTVRTLISTWLNTGQLSRAISMVILGLENIFQPYFREDAFLADKQTSEAFRKQLEILDGVDIMVETMSVLASPKLDLEAEFAKISSATQTSDGTLMRDTNTSDRLITPRSATEDSYSASAGDMIAHGFGISSTPRYLDFNRNSAFALSLRSERERRMRSWEIQSQDGTMPIIYRPGSSQNDIELHNELHKLARTFYNGTNMVTIRDAARRSDRQESKNTDATSNSETGKVSLVTVETVSNRRRIEVPDDDSSFLLRAQARQLNPVSVHRDERNHDLSYKCFLATYEEPAIHSGSSRQDGGRYIRRCFLQYYPIDRTATVMLHNDSRKLDRRKGRPVNQDQSATLSQPPPYLSGAFLRERHLCQKWISKGASSSNFLSSSVMEATDFNETPRSGKALDFVFRMSLFERPTIDLAGKRFTVHDSTARGPHRSDASALEVSDASLSALLLNIGRDSGRNDSWQKQSPKGDTAASEFRHKVEMGPDGYPMLFMKFNRKSNDEGSTEIKPYRMSFVRAALMVTSARQEAQLQCLMDCVKAGSAKSATKARTEARLKPTMKILQFANDRSSERLRTSSLLRDLKLGVYHIDREQLRRNGLLNPRDPTSILEFNVSVEGHVQAGEVAEIFASSKLQPTTILYRIRCSATVELTSGEDEATESYALLDGSLGTVYKEEWTVYRSMKDFQALHKHLKSQVAHAESSASTGSRLVGAATAAFSTVSQGRKNRRTLIPSLAQASKTGAIAVTQKAIAKRGELLGSYLDYLLSRSHILNRCMEILLFLGASFPFPSEVGVTSTPVRLVDPLGRTNFVRSIVSKERRHLQMSKAGLYAQEQAIPLSEESAEKQNLENEGRASENGEDKDMIVSILNKVDQVPLAEVRNRFVELVKYQFGFENASFFRSRMLSALETASFVAMTKASEFRKLLYKIHVQHLNPDAVAKLIEKVLDILWPDGCWLIPRPLLTPREECELREKSRQSLHEAFPEQIRAILGRELTRDGLDIVHEMLQNRLVVKSLFYMLFDLLWIEVFPELRDALPCASALDID